MRGKGKGKGHGEDDALAITTYADRMSVFKHDNKKNRFVAIFQDSSLIGGLKQKGKRKISEVEEEEEEEEEGEEEQNNRKIVVFIIF